MVNMKAMEMQFNISKISVLYADDLKFEIYSHSIQNVLKGNISMSFTFSQSYNNVCGRFSDIL